MLVDSALYIKGIRELKSEDLPTMLRLAKRNKGFVWMGLLEPTSAEFAGISEIFNIHHLAQEDAVHALQRPKFDEYPGLKFLVVKTVFFDGEENDVSTGELMFFIGDHFVITVRHGKGSPLTAIRSEVEARPEFLELGPWAVVYSILDRIVDQYIAIASQFDIAIASLEANVFSEERRNMSKNIYFLKREVIEYRHAVEPLLLPMQRVYLESDSLIPKELIPFFGDLNDHLIRACETSAGLDALLTTVLQADLVHVQLRQNDDVRKISSWVALAAGPTMIAGIYGMNFHNIPELKWKYGYFIVLGLMASLTGFIFYKLKKSKWL